MLSVALRKIMVFVNAEGRKGSAKARGVFTILWNFVLSDRLLVCQQSVLFLVNDILVYSVIRSQLLWVD